MLTKKHNINRDNNRIYISGYIKSQDSQYNLRKISNLLYDAIVKRKYASIDLDFSRCEGVYPAFMVPVVTIARKYLKDDGINFNLTLPPKNTKLFGLFSNANWAHQINPNLYDPSAYEGGDHVPMLQFNDATEQNEAVDRLMDLILSTLNMKTRGHQKALNWSLAEITDNVLNHAESSVGGFVQASTYKDKNIVEFIVSDAGVGIPETLNKKSNQPESLRAAVEEGVTRTDKPGRGNGLFGTYRIATISEGEFEIISDCASLIAQHGDIKTQNNPKFYKYPGTSVRCLIDCKKENLLEDALKFDNKPYDPSFDYIEKKYETESEDLVFKIKDYKNNLVSREGGEHLYQRLMNLIRSSGSNQKLLVDFEDVFIVSSSVADEVFGQIFEELGPINFMHKIQFSNLDSTIKTLIDRAITKRMTK